MPHDEQAGNSFRIAVHVTTQGEAILADVGRFLVTVKKSVTQPSSPLPSVAVFRDETGCRGAYAADIQQRTSVNGRLCEGP